MKYFLLFLFMVVLIYPNEVNAKILHVGAGFKYADLNGALQTVAMGDTILVHQGDLRWWNLFRKPERQCRKANFNYWFRRSDFPGRSTGNNDLLKLSGVDDFEIRNCRFINGSPGGSGIDMVGCHNGLITKCRFENQGSNSIQAKGGTSDIRIEANFFKNGGQRAVNLGGSTGLAFFRQLDARYEAARLKVYSNVFTGSQAAVAFVGCIDSEVVNNTIFLPEKWVIRILQETVDVTRFFPCGNNVLRNNIVYRDDRVSTDCNIGGNTNQQSFVFSNNLWYNPQNSGWAGPVLPVTESNAVVGKNPLFVNGSVKWILTETPFKCPVQLALLKRPALLVSKTGKSNIHQV